jgi:quercetin dioxygenase-like cupin family protein
MRRKLLGILVLALFSASAWAQFGDQMKVATTASNKFAALPVLPGCSPLAVQNGDPSKGPLVVLLKAETGCVIPWHWHSANESLMFVHGKAKVEMKSGAPQTLGAGDYIYLPRKQVHQFTCITACTLFLSMDVAFDIHYVDKSGKEIPPEEALKGRTKGATPHKKAD